MLVHAWFFPAWSLESFYLPDVTLPPLPSCSYPNHPCVLMARSLNGNQIGDAGVCGLGAGLAGNTALKTLL